MLSNRPSLILMATKLMWAGVYAINQTKKLAARYSSGFQRFVLFSITPSAF